jgi:hypothetical protein
MPSTFDCSGTLIDEDEATWCLEEYNEKGGTGMLVAARETLSD